MALSKNHFQLVGNVTRVPTLKYTQTGTAVTNLDIATNKGIKQQDGTWKDVATFHQVTVWGKTAEAVAKFQKGAKVMAEGHIEYSTYEKEGQKHYKTNLVADMVIGFLPAKEPSIDDDFPDNPQTQAKKAPSDEKPVSTDDPNGPPPF